MDAFGFLIKHIRTVDGHEWGFSRRERYKGSLRTYRATRPGLHLEVDVAKDPVKQVIHCSLRSASPSSVALEGLRGRSCKYGIVQDGIAGQLGLSYMVGERVKFDSVSREDEIAGRSPEFVDECERLGCSIKPYEEAIKPTESSHALQLCVVLPNTDEKLVVATFIGQRVVPLLTR